jgi:type IV secretory pathway component VirB8
METDSKVVAEMVQSGEYFEQSRAWYQAIYIGPISERTFFLLIAVFAALIGLMAASAVMTILPITDRPGIMLSNQRIDDAVPALVKLKQAKSMPAKDALQRFYVSNYVIKRESYAAAEYESNYRFIQAQSDPSALAEYVARYDRAVLSSPAAILAETGKRITTIQSIEVNDAVEPKLATVQFSTDIEGIEHGSSANWTAVLQFYYTDLTVVSVKDPVTGVESFKTQDPQFQVVNYALTQAR